MQFPENLLKFHPSMKTLSILFCAGRVVIFRQLEWCTFVRRWCYAKLIFLSVFEQNYFFGKYVFCFLSTISISTIIALIFVYVFALFSFAVVLLDTATEATLEWTRYPFGPEATTPGVSKIMPFKLI